MREILTRTFDAAAYDSLVVRDIDPRMAKLYAGRGVSDIFALNTKLDALLAPTLLSHIDAAAAFLADAIDAQKRLLIVADYDADGATACAVGVRALRQMGAIVDFMVPNRFTLGYGLTPEVVDLAIARHAGTPDIIITVDNGIASVDGVARANQHGIDVVVTDHHLPGATLPDAAVIVNPNQPGDTFPSKGLAGVGVMFYTMLAVRAEMRKRGAFSSGFEPNLADLLDLVALGTIADVVKLEHNNRILVEQGLQRIRAGRACKGIAALLAVGGRDASRASTYDLGFVLGPRINAAGRLEDMSVGIACLLSDDTATATRLAAQLDHLNRTRRDIEADMKVGALAALDALDIANRYALALFEPDWHQGVVGILAGRIREQTHRPVIAFAQDGTGGLKGSGRSIPALHMRDALDLITKRHPPLIEKFGGHAMAAGLTIRESGLADFALAFEQVARELLSPTDLQERIETDGSLAAGELDFNFVQALEAQVWGQGFVAPSY
ncbi:MAG: single-stranded-DNA-specific exonuclease RecJ, partial [Rhodocyclaceae bacterium]|nr:single-stranded-DNA-specific exonuclease RecJ [Rhodocyclaceae bacterium]